MTELLRHVEYSPEFLEEISERDTWSVEQWREVVNGWEDQEREDFKLITMLEEPRREYVARESYIYVQNFTELDLDKSESKVRDLFMKVMEQSKFFATYGKISDEARGRILDALTS